MSSRTFLDQVLIRLHQDRPKVPESLTFTISPDRYMSPVFRDSTNVAIGFRTRGCRYTHSGGCTMCDYWISDPVASKQMVAAVRAALAELEFEPSVLRVEVSGSFLDDWEVPPDARRQILQLLSVFEHTHLIFETHANMVSEGKILELADLLRHRRFSIEMGLESANPWILRYCVNKHLQLGTLVKALRLLKEHQVNSVVNVMVGVPLLSPSEMVADCVSSINWAFSQGADRCVLFTVNTKPWTLVAWLEERGMFERPPLWALVDVLSELHPQLLSRIGVAWYRSRPQQNPAYKAPNLGPVTCPHCYDKVIELLDRFVISEAREKALGQLVDLKCDCKDQWHAQRQQKSASSLDERVRDAYRIISEQLFNQTSEDQGELAFDPTSIPPFEVEWDWNFQSESEPIRLDCTEESGWGEVVGGCESSARQKRDALDKRRKGAVIMETLVLSGVDVEWEIARIVAFIRSQAGSDSRLLLGLSGGIDSDVAARLCVRAVGSERMKCFTVLQEDFDPKYVEHARGLAQDVGTRLVEIPLAPFPKQLFRIMAEADPDAGFVPDPSFLDIGRGKCALRTFIFSAYAERGYLVVGPSVRTELELGYFLPFGDALAHIQPIIHLYKSQVRQLARKLGTRPEVISQQPAAGFWLGDEDLRGIAYWLFNEGPIQIDLDLREEDKQAIREIRAELSFEAIDKALDAFNQGCDIDEIVQRTGLSAPTIVRLQKLSAKAWEYKRRQLSANLL